MKMIFPTTDRRLELKTSFFNEFLVLAEQLNFSKAAQKIGMNQSVLSRHIKQLEEEVGAPLFIRTTQKMELTPYGAALIPHARAILEQTHEFARNVDAIRRDAANRISLGVCGYPTYYGITALFAAFRNQYPDAMIDVHTDSFDDAFHYLNTGRFDAIFVHWNGEPVPQYEVIPFHEDYFSVSLPAVHPMADRETVSLADLKNEIFYIRHKKDSYMYNLELKALRSAGFEPKLSLNQSNWEDSIINHSNDISLVTQGTAQMLRNQLRVRVIDITPRIFANVSLVYLKDREQTKLVRSFLNFVREYPVSKSNTII